MWESYLYLITINKYTAVWTHVNAYTVVWHSKQQESSRITHRVFLEMCVCVVFIIFLCHLTSLIVICSYSFILREDRSALHLIKLHYPLWNTFTHTHTFNMCIKIWKSLQPVHNLKHTYKESTNVYNLSTCLLQTIFFILCITMHVRY